MTETPDLFKTVLALRKQGQGEELLGLLRDALRRRQVNAEGLERAGRIIHKELAARNGEARPLRVLVLGQCTTSWLRTVLTAEAWSHDVAALVEDGDYDNILQELTARSTPTGGGGPDVVVLVAWNRRLLAPGDRSPRDRVEDELAYWRQAWGLAAAWKGARVLQVGYDWVTPGAGGFLVGSAEGGDIDLVRKANAAVRAALPPGSYFLDLELVSGGMGRDTFYEPRRYFWTKQPYSEAGTALLAGHVWAGIRALTTGPKKVLVLDLDNTLWGGVVGEVGPLGVALGDTPDGEAFRAFQAHVKALAGRGIVLAVASKNNPADAREPFEVNPDMVLKLGDFAAFEVGWGAKSEAIGRIARDLNLGLDSFVFFDDNPAEREQLRRALPQVEVVDVPEDAAGYVRALDAGLWFESTGLTQADRDRVAQYGLERDRREVRDSFASMDDYLASLEMRAEIREIDEPDLPRVVQLLAKTNQFNLTTRRHTREDVVGLKATPGSIAWTLRMSDRFGDHGVVAVILGVPTADTEPPTIRIDTWLMSCRVIGRTAEHFLFSAFLGRSRDLGYGRILGEYIPTPKNVLVSGFYEELGFQKVPDGGEGVTRFASDLAAAVAPRSFLKNHE